MNEELAEVERELCRIPEVRAARIVADSSGNPVEVHVLAVPGKHAKQIVRDVQSVAMATVGMDIDHRIVSVVQLEDAVVPGVAASASSAAPPQRSASTVPAASAGERAEDGDVIVLDPPLASPDGDEPWQEDAHTRHDNGARPDPEHRAAPDVVALPVSTRIAVDRVLTLRRGLTCTAEVVLSLGDVVVTGDASGSAAASATLRLVAEATLDALRQLHPAAERVAVESASLARVGDRSIALTSIVLVIPPNEELVTGSAPVRGAGEHEAIARSVLDAVNRRLHEQQRPSL